MQFALSSLVGIIAAHDKGMPFTLVAPAGLATSDVAYSQFVVRADSTIKTGRDLNGKTIGAAGLSDLDTVAIENWVDQNGGDSTTLKFVEMPASQALAAIEEGRIDGADSTRRRSRAGSKRQGPPLAQIFDAIAPRFENTAGLRRPSTRRNRAVVQRFARVMADAGAYCNAHHADTVRSWPRTPSSTGPRRAHGAHHVRRLLRPADIQPLINVAAKYKAISKPFDARALISPYALKPPG